MTAHVILAVDSNQRNLELLSQVLTKEGYSMRLVSNLDEFSAAITQPDEIGLALVDISGFDRRIWGYSEAVQPLRRIVCRARSSYWREY